MENPHSVPPTASRTPDAWFLPNCCRMEVVFSAVLLAQLFAFVLVLAEPQPDIWLQLSHASLFIQWIVLTTVGCLCAAGALLRRMHPSLATLVAYLVLLAITATYSLGAGWIMGAQPWSGVGVAEGQSGFLVRNLTVSAIIGALLLRYAYIHHQWERRVHSEARARLDALQARIRPHFLFNSMNTIASLTRTRPAQAEEAVENLAELFRASLADGGRDSTLGDELALTRRYLDIERLRLGERLRVRWEVDGVPLDAALPPLTLQPLAENAVYHGVETAVEGGTICVGGERGRDGLTVWIANTVAEAGSNRYRRGNGMAVENIRGRLEAFFHGSADLSVQSSHQRYQVTLRLPHHDTSTRTK